MALSKNKEQKDDEKCDDCQCDSEQVKQEDECNCQDDEKCDCCQDEAENTCEENKECNCKKQAEKQAEEYLALARQVQADFENFRRHAVEDIKEAKTIGQASVIQVFLPCLDTFKEAKKSINDQVILDGINMIENQITNALASLGVEKIETVGQVYNPHLHEAITYLVDEEKDNNIILEEYQAGYTFNGKVIRYSKVIVNKRED